MWKKRCYIWHLKQYFVHIEVYHLNNIEYYVSLTETQKRIRVSHAESEDVRKYKKNNRRVITYEN